MSKLGTTTTQHVSTRTTFDSVESVGNAARELMTQAWSDIQRDIEPFYLRNTMILGGTASVNDSVSFGTVSQSNPYGTYRGALKPKAMVGDWETIKSMADITFDDVSLDEIIFKIDTAVKSRNERLNAADRGGWLYDGFETAIQTTIINSITTKINYEAYDLMKADAKKGVDPIAGKGPRVSGGWAAKTDKEFVDELFAVMQSYIALPNDRYVYGFEKPELRLIISPEAQLKILIEKLTIVDGFFPKGEGQFFNGLPWQYQYNGVPTIVSRYLNGTMNLTSEKAEFLMLPAGRFAPFMFDIGLLGASADVIPFSGNSIAYYGWALYGMQTIPELRHLITVGFSDTFTEAYGDSNMTNVIATKPAAGEISVSGDFTGSVDRLSVDVYDGMTYIGNKSITTSGETVTFTDADGIVAGKQYVVKVHAQFGGNNVIDGDQGLMVTLDVMA